MVTYLHPSNSLAADHRARHRLTGRRRRRQLLRRRRRHVASAPSSLQRMGTETAGSAWQQALLARIHLRRLWLTRCGQHVASECEQMNTLCLLTLTRTIRVRVCVCVRASRAQTHRPARSAATPRSEHRYRRIQHFNITSRCLHSPHRISTLLP